MRTSETLLLDFIRQSPQFRIPVNQRRFAWTQRGRQLWEDILDAGERADVREHFLGPVMYLAVVDPLNAHWSPYLVYDGQQRLTTPMTPGRDRMPAQRATWKSFRFGLDEWPLPADERVLPFSKEPGGRLPCVSANVRISGRLHK